MNSSVISDYIRIITLGISGVGKTNIIKVYTGEAFIDIFISTIGLEYSKKTIKDKIDDKPVTFTVDLFDTAGQEKFRCINKNYYNKKHGAILVFDLTNKESLESISFWLTEINNSIANLSNYPFLLLGNKSDMTEKIEVSKEDVDNFMLNHNLQCKYYEVSAKTGADKIDEVITEFCKLIYAKLQETPVDLTTKIDSRIRQQEKMKCCA